MSADEISQAKAQMSLTVDKTKMYTDMNQSKAYAEYRPRYSDEFFKAIVDYCKETSSTLNTAVDVGCGPGMSSIGFAKYFKKVIGVDVSPTQIACAPKDIPNMEFKVGYSDKLPFIQSGTVDLFCTGESFNLMPQKETFAEADRVLKPGGTIAIFGYDIPKADNAEIDAIIKNMWIKLLPYWPKESTQIFDKFESLKLPFPGQIRRTDMASKQRMTINDWIGLVKSLWPTVAYGKDHPEEDFVGDVEKNMSAAMKKVSGGLYMDVVWELFVVMAHKPKN